MLTLAVVAFVAAMASCSKTCTCKTYAGGQVVSTQEDVDLGEYDSCEKMSLVMGSGSTKTGTECE